MRVYNRRMAENYNYLQRLKDYIIEDQINRKFHKHSEMRKFQSEVKKRVEIRMQQYEDWIDRRREKLRDLLAKEEREFYHETINVAQRGLEFDLQEKKDKIQRLQAEREQKRLALLEQKRLQQYRNRCPDLLEVQSHQNLIECKNAQLQQIRENEARREADRELERMWHNLTVKENRAKAELNEHNTINVKQKEKELVKVWNSQMRGKDELKVEKRKIAEEERVEYQKLRAQAEKEEYEALIAKERKRELIASELEEQLEMKEKCLAQRKKEDEALIRAFNTLAEIENDREKSKIQNTALATKQETIQYRESLAKIDHERKAEDARLNDLLEKFMKEAEQKQMDGRCKVELAKRELHKDVLKGRSEQIQHKQTLAKEQLKMIQAENEFTRMCCQTNQRLAAEMSRNETIAKTQYRQDLLQQIEYKKKLQQKEKEKLERQLAEGVREEERYLNMVEKFCTEDVPVKKHPFRCVLERYDCNCPENPNMYS